MQKPGRMKPRCCVLITPCRLISTHRTSHQEGSFRTSEYETLCFLYCASVGPHPPLNNYANSFFFFLKAVPSWGSGSMDRITICTTRKVGLSSQLKFCPFHLYSQLCFMSGFGWSAGSLGLCASRVNVEPRANRIDRKRA